MSANICWRPRPVKDNNRLDVPAPSSFQDMMFQAGLALPCTITDSNFDKIHGMAIAFGPINDKERPNPFQQILDLLEKYHAVELWAIN